MFVLLILKVKFHFFSMMLNIRYIHSHTSSVQKAPSPLKPCHIESPWMQLRQRCHVSLTTQTNHES